MKSIKLIVLLVAVLSISACSGTSATPTATPVPTVVADNTIVTEGRLEPIHYADLALNASGLVSEVLLKEGDTVAAGDVIARLESTNAQSLEDAQAKAARDLTAAYQEVRDTQYDFDNFDVPTDFKPMTPTEAVPVMLEKLNTARTNFEPYKDRDERSLSLTESERATGEYRDQAKRYKKELDDAWADYRKAVQWMDLETNLNSAKARLVLAQKDYDALNDPTFKEDTAGLRAALANAEVRAPFPGVVTNLDLKVGEFAASGQTVITIADVSKWVVKTTDLTEIDVVSIKEGQTVVVKFDALPDKEFNGNVLSIAQNYSEKQGDIVYEVTVLLTEVDPAMRWGMTAEVSFSE
jgi:multidrug efflux pump subunit AcrA (membrane-fusion protein)